MKKILALILACCLLFSFVSCSETYKPQKSTKEESRVTLKLQNGKNKYEVKYELYRFFFLTYRDSIDGGDRSVWSSDGADAYIEKMNALILDRVCDVYAVFALCDEIGIDLYAKDVDKQVEELIKVNVEGGSYNGTYYDGFDSYDDYLASLKAAGGNYAVSDLFFRYAIGLTALANYYAGLGDGLGNLTPTDQELTDFFESENTARMLFVYFDRDIAEANPSRVQKILNTVQQKTTADSLPEAKDADIATYLLGQMSNMAEEDVLAGEIVTAYSLDNVSYADVAENALALSEGEASPLFEIVTDAFDGIYFIYRMSKPADYLSENRDRVMNAYIADTCGKKLADTKTALLDSAEETKVLATLSYETIGQ